MTKKMDLGDALKAIMLGDPIKDAVKKTQKLQEAGKNPSTAVLDYARSLMKDGDVFTRGDVYHFVDKSVAWGKRIEIESAILWLSNNAYKYFDGDGFDRNGLLFDLRNALEETI